MKIIRVLEYEGIEEWIKMILERRAIKTVVLVPTIHGASIKERFVTPDPLPEWWSGIVDPERIEEDPSKKKENEDA